MADLDTAQPTAQGYARFAAAMRQHGEHFRIGNPPRCAADGQAWPCETERGDGDG